MSRNSGLLCFRMFSIRNMNDYIWSCRHTAKRQKTSRHHKLKTETQWELDIQWFIIIINTATHDHHHFYYHYMIGFLPLLQEHLNISQNWVCFILALHMLLYIHTHTHTHTSDMLNTCVMNMNWRFLSMHHTELIGHLTVSISVMTKPNNMWKALDADRKVSMHKTLNCVRKRKVYQKNNNLINMYTHYPTQHMANLRKIQTIMQT